MINPIRPEHLPFLRWCQTEAGVTNPEPLLKAIDKDFPRFVALLATFAPERLQESYSTFDKILTMLDLTDAKFEGCSPDGVQIRVDVRPTDVVLHVGPRNWQWDRITGRLIGQGTQYPPCSSGSAGSPIEATAGIQELEAERGLPAGLQELPETGAGSD